MKNKKPQKKSTSKRQLNKLKRAQAKLKAKASERRRRRIARNSINIPRKFKFKHLTKRVNHNGGSVRWHNIPKPTANLRRGCVFLVTSCNLYKGQFKLKMMIRISTRLRRRMESIKRQLQQRLHIKFNRACGRGYRRHIRARVTFSERSLGLRLGKGKGKLGGWRIPLKINNILYSVTNLSSHGGQNIIKRSRQRLGNSIFISGYSVYR